MGGMAVPRCNIICSIILSMQLCLPVITVASSFSLFRCQARGGRPKGKRHMLFLPSIQISQNSLLLLPIGSNHVKHPLPPEDWEAEFQLIQYYQIRFLLLTCMIQKRQMDVGKVISKKEYKSGFHAKLPISTYIIMFNPQNKIIQQP